MKHIEVAAKARLELAYGMLDKPIPNWRKWQAQLDQTYGKGSYELKRRANDTLFAVDVKQAKIYGQWNIQPGRMSNGIVFHKPRSERPMNIRTWKPYTQHTQPTARW